MPYVGSLLTALEGERLLRPGRENKLGRGFFYLLDDTQRVTHKEFFVGVAGLYVEQNGHHEILRGPDRERLKAPEATIGRAILACNDNTEISTLARGEFGGHMSDRPLVTDWAADWDFYGRQYHEDAPSVWRELRESCPLAHTDRYGGAWATIRYEDVCAAAHDPATFSSRHQSLADDYEINRIDQPPINLDPPVHSSFRRILLPQFGPPAVAALRPLTEQICEDLLDRLAERREMDASADFARHIPVVVTAAMLGVPDSDADLFRDWVHDIVEAPGAGSQVRAGRECLAYLRAQLVQRRNEPGDDIISLLARSEFDGVPLADRTIAAAAFVVLVAGIDTVWTTLAAAILHLARHPEDLRRLQDEPALLDTAIEEFLRFYAPVELSRLVTRDTELGGTTLKAGEHVSLSFPAANRDPDVFPDADTFVIDRAHNRHLAFGVGIHRCIGSNLARMELHVALTAWIRRIPRFTVDTTRPVEMTKGGIVRGPRSVPLTIG